MKCLFILLLCSPIFCLAQNKPLEVEGSTPNLYLTHKVQPKENYYSIGRMYNISPKEIAPFNSLQLEKGLSLNQIIKIPLTALNFVQTNIVAADETLVPVYHAVQDKEGLYRIAANYNKISLPILKQWNHLKTDAVPNGTNLIIGYVKVKKTLSPLASKTFVAPVAAVAVAPVTVDEPQAPAVVIKEKVPTPLVKKDTPITYKKLPAAAEAIPTNTVAAGKNFDGGFFKNDFTSQVKNNEPTNENGTAAVFKSNSGWDNGKYYCLHNTAKSGAIIKITSKATGKIVYAKVLDIIPDLKQNAGLLIRVSNAAAQELGVGETKFDCTLDYVK